MGRDLELGVVGEKTNETEEFVDPPHGQETRVLL